MLRAAAAGARAAHACRAPRAAAAAPSFSTHYVGDDADALADIIKRHVAPTPPRPAHPALLTTRADALSLYRAIWRATAAFTWPNERGVPWRDVLRASARGEFEEARTLTDPEAVARALVVGRDALGRALEKVREKAGEGRK